MDISIRWLWAAMVGGSIMLAVPGNKDFLRMAGDVVGPLFTACLLAIVPIVGYRILYGQIGEKEITLIIGATWVYLVLSKFLGL